MNTKQIPKKQYKMLVKAQMFMLQSHVPCNDKTFRIYNFPEDALSFTLFNLDVHNHPIPMQNTHNLIHR